MNSKHSGAAIAVLMLVAFAPALRAQGHGGGNDKGRAHANVAARVGGHGNAHKADVQDHDRRQAPERADRGESTRRVELRPDHPVPRASVQGRLHAAPNSRVGQLSAGEVARIRNEPRVVYVRPLPAAKVRPVMRQYVISAQPRQRVLGSALAYALARGVPDNRLLLVPVGDRFAIRNRTGVTLLDLNDNDANDIGAFRVVPVTTTLRDNAPAFCRSGAGHPVWGRQWCIDKGFGLGGASTVRWGRVVQPSYIVMQQAPVTNASANAMILTDILRTVLGAQTFDRLALHALTLGYSDPLTGRWMGEPTGQRTLLVSSGTYPVAEVVDLNRDGRADNAIVALKPW
jgi:hypothetical protein